MYNSKEKEIMKKLVIKIIEFRHKNQLTQEKFSEKIDYQREHVAKIETGKRNLTLKYILRICIAFNIDISELMS